MLRKTFAGIMILITGSSLAGMKDDLNKFFAFPKFIPLPATISGLEDLKICSSNIFDIVE